VTITRLGEGLARTGRIAPAAAARTLRAVRRCLRDGPAAIVATHALRAARNRDEVLRRWGLDVRVLTPAEEARASFAGATSGLGDGRFVIVDVGGGSTEVATERTHLSFPIGAATLAQMLPARDRHEMELYCTTRIGRPLQDRFRRRGVVAVGGTAATLAMMETGTVDDMAALHGLLTTTLIVRTWADRLWRYTIAQRCGVPGVDRGRADILPAGLTLLGAALGGLGANRFAVSTRGVRHGIALGAVKW
jgi:exopolyphosphatase/guanosine-5'-triphosphate,3'-diphosphate pyrophosphatase